MLLFYEIEHRRSIKFWLGLGFCLIKNFGLGGLFRLIKMLGPGGVLI